MIKEITVILISHKSKIKVLDLIKNFSKKVNIIIIENSDDQTIQKEIDKTNKKIKLIFSKNNGYGSGINLARKYVKTNYFIVLNPDVKDINEKVLEKFFDIGKKLNDTYACIGPRYLNISKKTLIQSNESKEIDTLPSISGAVMFFNKKNFDLISGFDENIFLYFEETDYCFRAKKKGLKSYQINSIKINHEVGTSITIENENEKIKYKYLHIWHFIWSKFYFYRKHYGYFFSIIIFFPIYLRSLIKLVLFKILSKNEKKMKYQVRCNGLISSIKGVKSYKRINNF